MLPLTFGAPALGETAVLFFPSKPLSFTLLAARLCGVGKTAVIDTDKRYTAFRMDSLTGVHVCCGTFHRVSCNETLSCCCLISIP